MSEDKWKMFSLKHIYIYDFTGEGKNETTTEKWFEPIGKMSEKEKNVSPEDVYIYVYIYIYMQIKFR
jgi:hypothetical protein